MATHVFYFVFGAMLLLIFIAASSSAMAQPHAALIYESDAFVKDVQSQLSSNIELIRLTPNTTAGNPTL